MSKANLQDSGYVTANGVRIYYETMGSGEPLLLVHGGGMTLGMWHCFAPTFAQHSQVITLDSRGHGKTNNPSGQITYRLMADDVAAFIVATGLDRPIVCGYSDGGLVAFEMAMNYPGLARGYIIGGAYRELTVERKQQFAELFGMLGPGDVDVEHFKRLHSEFAEVSKAMHAWPDEPERWQVLFRQLSYCWLEPMNHTRSDLQRIIEPALVLVGDRDEFVKVSEALSIYADLPKGELSVIPNGNHVSVIEANPLFEKTVVDFLHRHF